MDRAVHERALKYERLRLTLMGMAEGDVATNVVWIEPVDVYGDALKETFDVFEWKE